MSADPIDLDDLIERCEELSEADFDGGCCNASYPINGVSRALREAAVTLAEIQRRREQRIAKRETPAPAMPNGVDSVAYLLDELRFSRRGYFTSQRRGELADKLESAIAADFDRLRAADNRDAAGVDSEEDAYVIERMGKLLAEIAVIVNGPEPDMTRWSYHDLPEKVRALKDTPAAVPAGEAVAVCGTCNGVGMIGGHRGQTPDSFEQWAEDCPDCTPQPADGGAVAWADLPWRAATGWLRSASGSKIAEVGTGAGCISQRESELIANAVNAYTTPPAAQVHGDKLQRWALALGSDGPAGYLERDPTGEWVKFAHVQQLALAANPSACELGAVRELVKVWRIAVNSASTTNKQDLRPERFIRELEAALQHRGDSQEVGRG